MGGMRSLLMGLDVSPRRMGWGLCDLVTGEPVACGCEAINLPPDEDHPERTPWDRRRVRDALRELPTSHGLPEVQAVYIEEPALPPISGTMSAYKAGQAVGIVRAEVQRRWPHAPVQTLKVPEWKNLAGLKGNASKAEVWAVAFDLFVEHGFTLDATQDAADALLIAVAGQRRNGENWTRAVERGEAA